MKLLFPYDGNEHLGIGYLATIARYAGHDVELMPLRSGDYITGYRELTDKEIQREARALLAKHPDIVAFSLCSPSAGALIDVARVVRRSGVKTIAGGPHASAEPEITIESEAFDVLVRGEADEVFEMALEATLQGFSASVAWLDTPGSHSTQTTPVPFVDNLFWPAKDLFYEHNPYQKKDYLILASRGCPYSCAFCAGAYHTGKKHYRQRSPVSVVEELLWAKRTFSPQSVYFLDDVFTLNREWLVDFLPLYRKKIGLPFHAISHPMQFDEEKAYLLKEAGCFAMRIGVQTLTPRMRKMLGRPEDTETVTRAIAVGRKAGLRVEIDHMVNIPGETLEDARQALSLYNHIRPDAIKVYWFTPLPGSRWFEQAKVEGWLSSETEYQMRRGKGYGYHSYLFKNIVDSDSRWIGIHVMLSYLPHLPHKLVRILIRIKADRFLRLSSFVFAVGIPRAIQILKGWDCVGEGHLKKMMARFSFWKTGPNAMGGSKNG